MEIKDILTTVQEYLSVTGAKDSSLYYVSKELGATTFTQLFRQCSDRRLVPRQAAKLLDLSEEAFTKLLAQSMKLLYCGAIPPIPLHKIPKALSVSLLEKAGAAIVRSGDKIVALAVVDPLLTKRVFETAGISSLGLPYQLASWSMIEKALIAMKSLEDGLQAPLDLVAQAQCEEILSKIIEPLHSCGDGELVFELSDRGVNYTYTTAKGISTRGVATGVPHAQLVGYLTHGELVSRFIKECSSEYVGIATAYTVSVLQSEASGRWRFALKRSRTAVEYTQLKKEFI